MLLEIELVPHTSWYSNVRSNVSKEDWDTIRKEVYRRADYTCEICGGKGHNHPVEAHEVWYFDKTSRMQVLEEIQALCPNCHMVKHIGLAEKRGHYGKAIRHFMKVNGVNLRKANKYVEEAYSRWRELNKVEEWTLDIDIINDYFRKL